MMPNERLDLQYTRSERDRISAFLLLAHAELEFFVEDWTFELAVEALKKWRLDGRPRASLLSLVAYHESKRSEMPLQLTPGDTAASIDDRLGTVVTAFCRHVRVVNNGIKQKDLLSMLLPIGLTEVELDVTWLESMDAFGEQRGEIAHKSAAQTMVVITPTEAVERVDNVVAQYERLDAKFQDLALR